MKHKILFVLVALVLVSGCKKSSDSIPDSSSLIEQARHAAQQALSNATIPESGQQIVIPPQQIQQSPQTTMQGSDVISKNYIAPCTLQKYKVLNVYCKGKTFWGKQSTLASWYVPYSLVLFVLVVFVVYFIIKLWNRN